MNLPFSHHCVELFFLYLAIKLIRTYHIQHLTQKTIMVKEITTYQDYTSAINSSRKVLICFCAVYCAPCRKIGPSLDALQKEFQNKALIYKVDVSLVPRAMAEQNVEAMPCFRGFVGGKVVFANTGFNLLKIKEFLK